MKREKIIVINRWNDEFSNYGDYLNHLAHDVAYLVNNENNIVINETMVKGVEIVPDLTNYHKLTKAANKLKKKLGGVTKIIALSEFDLEAAAFLRGEFDVPGICLKDILKYRDKTVMKELIQNYGLKTPPFVKLSSINDAIEFSKKHGYPLILKPKKGASSQGVMKINNSISLNKAIQKIYINDYECEKYIDGAIYHVDGLIKDNDIIFCKVSKYVNNCLDFNRGVPLGSVIIDDVHMTGRMFFFTTQVLKALLLVSGAFHLEVILSKTNKLYFLEIGARVGGGEIPFLIYDIYGVNLIKEWIKIEMNETTNNLKIKNFNAIGGFLMIPEPIHTPCRVKSCLSLLNKVNFLYHEIIPKSGYLFKGDRGYNVTSGKFRFSAPTSIEVERAILETINKFSIIIKTIRKKEEDISFPSKKRCLF